MHEQERYSAVSGDIPHVFIMKYIIEWRDQFKKYHKFQEKSNEADAIRVATKMAQQKGKRFRVVSASGSLLEICDP